MAGWAKCQSSFFLLHLSNLSACTSMHISQMFHIQQIPLSSLSTLLAPSLFFYPSFYPSFSSLQHCTSVPPPPTTRLVLFFLPTSPTPSFHPTISLPSTSPPFLLAYSPSYLLSSSHPHGKDSVCHFFPILIICCNLNHVPLPFLRSCP